MKSNRFEAVHRYREHRFSRLAIAMCLSGVISTLSPAVVAKEFSLGEDWQGTFDTTVTYSAMLRLRDPDRTQMEIGADGIPVLPAVTVATAHNPNADDGNYNFGKGDIVSNVIKLGYDFELKNKLESGNTIGFFNRVLGYYDQVIMHEGTDYDGTNEISNSHVFVGESPYDFSDETKDMAGKNIRILDAFAYFQGFIGETALTVRLGDQVINWGENAFIQSGISNAINPADITQARLPGTAVKDILLPQGALFTSVGLTNSLTVEGYYQYDWQPTIAPPTGTFFSTNDFIAEDGGKAIQTPADEGHPAEGNSGWLRGPDLDAKNSGQWGLAVRWFSEALNETDFGFYIVNYHSKLPSVGVSGPPTNVDPNAYYNIGYLEDVRLYGISFNTVAWETAFSGEIAYHEDTQVQTTQFGSPAIVKGVANPGTRNGLVVTPENVVVAQLTINKNLSTTDGFRDLADAVGFIIELGAVYTPGLKDGEIFRGPDVADQFAWGYKGRLSLTYFDGVGQYVRALSGTDLGVNVNFSHDVDGISAIAAGSFTDGAKSFGVNISANWQNTLEASFGVNYFFDSIVDDRDNLSLAIKYMF